MKPSGRFPLRPFLGSAFSVLEEGSKLANSWYLGCVCEHAEAVRNGQLPRLVVTQPPGTLKSMTWGAVVPAWAWADEPFFRFLMATHDLNNASRDAGFCRKLIQSEWYQRTFQPAWKLAGDQNAKLYYQTTKGGHRLAISTGGATAGKKGHWLMSDDLHDPVKVHSRRVREGEKDWFRTGFSDRMMNFKTSAITSIGHRVHKEDLNNDLINQGWPELKLPEVFHEAKRKTFPVPVHDAKGRTMWTDPRTEGQWLRPDRFGPKEREDVEKLGGVLAFKAKHQQQPESRTDAMFDPAKAHLVETYPVGTVAVRYWDTAASEGESACHSSGVLIGKTPEGRFIVIDVERGRMNPAKRNTAMRNSGLLDMRRPGLKFRRLYWEKGTSDSGVERDQLLARFLAGIPCAADRARGPKVQRAEALSSQWAAGNVDVVIGGWTEAYLSRMAEFPHAGDKDDTDATSGGFNRLALVNDDADAYQTAPAGETITEQVPRGTFDTRPPTDPYA